MIKGLWRALAPGAAAPLAVQAALAGPADVLQAEAHPEGPNLWRFTVTVQHADEGWEHYADKWEVVGPDGTIYATRVLQHPHETEQPFSRSLGGVVVPEGVTEATVRAHDRLHGYGGAEVTVTFSR